MIYKNITGRDFEMIAEMLDKRAESAEMQTRAARMRAEYESFAVDLAHEIRARAETNENISFCISGKSVVLRDPNSITHNSFPWGFSTIAEHPEFEASPIDKEST